MFPALELISLFEASSIFVGSPAWGLVLNFVNLDIVDTVKKIETNENKEVIAQETAIDLLVEENILLN